MKTKVLFYGLAVIALFVFVALFCASPQNPRTEPGNAKILSVLNFQDTVDVGVTWPCTVSLQLPELIDSIIVKKKTGTVYTHNKVSINNLLVPSSYGFSFTAPRKDTMLFIIRKQNGEKDTLAKPTFAQSLHIKVQKICVLNTCGTWFDTLYADTCAYDLDSIVDSTQRAALLWWPNDTIKGKTYRLVKNYITICIGTPPACFTLWLRHWTIEYNDTGSGLHFHLCSQTGLDTLRWTVISNGGDTVTQPLILKRSATCP